MVGAFNTAKVAEISMPSLSKSVLEHVWAFSRMVIPLVLFFRISYVYINSPFQYKSIMGV